MAQPDPHRQQLLEQVWQVTVSNLGQATSEVVVPAYVTDVLGQAGLETMIQRFRFVRPLSVWI